MIDVPYIGFPVRLYEAVYLNIRASLKSVMRELRARRMEHRNRSVLAVREDFEHHPSADNQGA